MPGHPRSSCWQKGSKREESGGDEPLTQLSVLRAPKGIEVPLAVHYHAEFSPAGQFGNWLPVVHDLKRRSLKDGSRFKSLQKPYWRNCCRLCVGSQSAPTQLSQKGTQPARCQAGQRLNFVPVHLLPGLHRQITRMEHPKVSTHRTAQGLRYLLLNRCTFHSLSYRNLGFFEISEREQSVTSFQPRHTQDISHGRNSSFLSPKS